MTKDDFFFWGLAGLLTVSMGYAASGLAAFAVPFVFLSFLVIYAYTYREFMRA